MTSTTKNSTSAVDNGGGSDAWDSLTGIVSGDSGNAAGVSINNSETNYIKVYFGLTTSDIPSGSTIDGIQFAAHVDGDSNYVQDVHVYLVKAGTVQTGGTNKANAARWKNGFSGTTQTYGANASVSSTWGVTVTDSDLRSASFGIAISATGESGDSAWVDYVALTVWYTAPAGGRYFVQAHLNGLSCAGPKNFNPLA